MDNVNNIYKCTPDQTWDYIVRCIVNGLVPFVQSSPGCGKSSIVKQIADKFNAQLIDVRLSTCDPTDLTGLPHFKDNIAEFAPFNLFPIESTPIPKGKSGWILFLDEFNSASKAVQAAAYKLILDRMVGINNLHPNCAIVCAGNLSTDRAIVNNLSTAMQSRVIHIEMEVNFDQWYQNVAIKNNYDQRIIGFLNMYQHKLMDFNPDHQEKTFCCPRTWEFVNRLITNEDNLDPILNLLVGTITSGIAIEFVQWSKIYQNLIKFEDILKEPEKVKIPTDTSIKWATTSMLITKTDAKTLDKVSKYIDRFDVSFKLLFYRSILIKDPELKTNMTLINNIASISKYLQG